MNEDRQTQVVEQLFATRWGRAVLSIITKPWASKLAGRFMDSRASKLLISRFVDQNGINLSHYEDVCYTSFNDFFTRKIKEEHRPVSMEGHELVSPCDGRLSVYAITHDNRVVIKGHAYTLTELLRDEALASQYDGGKMLIIRLTVADYHRYHYPDNGDKSHNVRIPGVLHTVHPIAAEKRRIYTENAREYFELETENFGKILYIQVGALLVGEIMNRHGVASVRKGEEAGHFKYGGSTVVLCLKKDVVEMLPEFHETTDRDHEIPVKMGQVLGYAI